ncbi:MAG TPA: TadE/TadG family type IV pilus assembly protein [Gemmatimonadales bacterium]|nr:TadE/TadG family type IV pilus assembly protein [Gemmatimonadales bacterium]
MRVTRPFRSERAAAMVEFAIVLPILLLMVFGIVDFGRALYTLNNLTAAVREGARLASTQISPDPTTGSSMTAVSTAVTNYVVAFGGNAGAPTVSETFSGTPPNMQSITVQIVNYPFTPITPLTNLIGLGTIQMSPSATFRWEGAP